MLMCIAIIFISAFLLFLVQPLIGKIILPWFGGSAAVWSAALMFFQVALLAGYLYAHCLATYLKPRGQFLVHGTLLVVSCALLPILPSSDWRPIDGTEPIFRITELLATHIGLPYFLLSSTSPLLQVWYLRRKRSGMPYRLFALSNLASLLALVGFPFVIEPNFDSRSQAYGWSALYVIFAALCGYAAWTNWKGVAVEGAPPLSTNAGAAPSRGQLMLWITLAACASMMLMAVTSHLSSNVAPIPLLWVAPLALYLLTFILAFNSDRIYRRWAFFPWVASVLGWMAYSISAGGGNLQIQYTVPIYLIGLFLTCMLCHGELAQRRPSSRYLTRFYLLVAFGSALGGLFVALVAPNLFDTFLELPLVLAVMAILAVIVLWPQGAAQRTWGMRVALIAGVTLFVGYLAWKEKTHREGYRLISRNFYGVLKVRDSAVGTPWATRDLTHGTISHGSQYLNEADRYLPASYYSPTSGVGRALTALQAEGPIRYGVIGLGVGVLSAYARKEDAVRLYEINPDVLSVAQEQFSFLTHAMQLGADIEILMGDARLTLETQTPQHYDLLAVDAFSSDAIPVHLLTKESFAVYFKHLKPRGVLAVHLSNRYLDLAPVGFRAAEYVNRSARVIEDPGSATRYSSPSTWMLITADQTFFSGPYFSGAKSRPPVADSGFGGWTDRYSSLWPLVRFKSL